METKRNTGMIATFGAGCFWGVEAAFRTINGVTSTAVGYMGGTREHPQYEEVCTGRTGHAEVVQVRYDPDIVTYNTLLDRFWSIHDPTQLNRQGPDTGTNYRSVIFYHDAAQEAAARAAKDRLSRTDRYHDKTIVTEIVPASVFWRAEEYHQQYFEKRGGGSCRSGEYRN